MSNSYEKYNIGFYESWCIVLKLIIKYYIKYDFRQYNNRIYFDITLIIVEKFYNHSISYYL